MWRLASRLLLLGLAGMLGYFLHSWRQATDVPADEESVVERPALSVVTQIRALARLEGAQFHMERIVDLRERQTRLRGLIHADDKLMLVAVGDVIAGVDLSRLVSADVNVSADGRSLRLQLPSAEVFSSALDAERTYVHSRDTDLLAEQSKQLETRARQKATAALRQGALDANILAKAEASVSQTLTTLLTSLGFQSVDISYGPAAPALEQP